MWGEMVNSEHRKDQTRYKWELGSSQEQFGPWATPKPPNAENYIRNSKFMHSMRHPSTAGWPELSLGAAPCRNPSSRKSGLVAQDDSAHPARLSKQSWCPCRAAIPGTSCYCSMPPTQPPERLGKHTLQTHSPVLRSLLPARAVVHPMKRQHRDGKTHLSTWSCSTFM